MKKLHPGYALYERQLKREISRGHPVEHVAIILDGNRRFARRWDCPLFSATERAPIP